MTNEKNEVTHLTKMTPLQAEAHAMGVEVADAAFLQEAGKAGVTAEGLRTKWHDAYMLGRNAMEHTLGGEQLAQDRISEIRSRQQE